MLNEIYNNATNAIQKKFAHRLKKETLEQINALENGVKVKQKGRILVSFRHCEEAIATEAI